MCNRAMVCCNVSVIYHARSLTCMPHVHAHEGTVQRSCMNVAFAVSDTNEA